MILSYLMETTGSADTEPFPYQMISGSGMDWFYDPVTRTMVESPRGIEIVQISEDTDHKGRVLVRAPFQFLMIPEEEVVDLGFN
tara:strand:- start:8386 stop:8637 length:252 start_codon:yes stop_codon:yes gene_type:complete